MKNLSKKKLLEKRLSAYYNAELAVLSGQKYQIGTRTLERAELSEIRKAIETLEIELANLENGGKRKVFRVVPRDL